ncbi:uncharacterized protein ASCRUDRAFT_76793 [Ascoidea rubescens DSM 1968]|uniref:Uncharacterized protein n=1 Tax=Ascoidea rubescens DSM 1968 TaxID=1344418 RepID=A0A1D2VEB8_9ASCO|nr:hypothetical protein ASCRUDRAFT_76793 [Ascoidea rubescens DSM 1968]ODV59843.1 hypothetical protein ASCRUDRAFT_76793 [Ascoidea rubescens DSM 1968]
MTEKLKIETEKIMKIFEKKLDSSNLLLKDLKNECLKLKAEMEDKINFYENKIEMKEKAIETLKETIDNEKLGAFESFESHLKTQNELVKLSKEEYNRFKSEADNKIKSLEEIISSRNSEINQVKLQLNEETQKLKKLEESLYSKINLINNIKKENSDLNSKISHLKTDMLEQERIVNKLKNENKNKNRNENVFIEEAKSAIRKLLEEFKKENIIVESKSKKTIVELEDKIKMSNLKLIKFESVYFLEREKCQTLQNKVEETKKILINEREIWKKLSQENNLLNKIKVKLSNDIEDLNKKNKNYEHTIKNLQEKVKDLGIFQESSIICDDSETPKPKLVIANTQRVFSPKKTTGNKRRFLIEPEEFCEEIVSFESKKRQTTIQKLLIEDEKYSVDNLDDSCIDSKALIIKPSTKRYIKKRNRTLK